MKELTAVMAFIIACNKVWPSTVYITVETLLQNMIMSMHTWEEYSNYLDAIKAASELVGRGEHVIAAVYEHARMIVDGYFMSQAYEQEEEHQLAQEENWLSGI